MSLLDGKVDLRNSNGGGKGRQQNNGAQREYGFQLRGEGENNRRSNNYNYNNRGGKRYEDRREFTLKNSSFVNNEERGKNSIPNEFQQFVKDKRADEILDFCDRFSNNANNFRNLQNIVTDDFPSVIPYINSYYAIKNNSTFQDALNKLILLMCTSQFGTVIKSVLSSGIWNDDGVYSKIWNSIGFGLSLALINNYDRMNDSTIKIYVYDIFPRMYKIELNEFNDDLGITRDLALDLMINIPIRSNDWNDGLLNVYFYKFLEMMVRHADDNIDVLNWEVQGSLFNKIFGKNHKTVLKVIGKFLSARAIPVENLNSTAMRAVYKDFKKMLYKKLDKYDIDDIAYAINYVASNKGEDTIIFNTEDASSYENVRKGIADVSSAKSYNF